MSHMQQQRHTAGHNYLCFIARKGLFRLVVESIFSVRVPGPLIKPLVISKIPLGQRQAKRCLQTCTKSVVRSFCACAKYYKGLCYPLVHSVVSSYFVSGQWRLIRLHECAGWSGLLLSAYARSHDIACRGPLHKVSVAKCCLNQNYEKKYSPIFTIKWWSLWDHLEKRQVTWYARSYFHWKKK